MSCVLVISLYVAHSTHFCNDKQLFEKKNITISFFFFDCASKSIAQQESVDFHSFYRLEYCCFQTIFFLHHSECVTINNQYAKINNDEKKLAVFFSDLLVF